MDQPNTFPCPNCGNILQYGALACPRCGSLVYSDKLNEIAGQAMREEALHPARAAMLWQQTLPLLPPQSEQHRMVASRIGMLASQLPISGQTVPLGSELPPPAQPRGSDPWPVALAKTGGSMAISIFVYSGMWGWKFATGFVLLILIHELGHTLAMRYYGLSAGPPIFIPFLGALINLRQPPRNALEEAVVGIGGPVTGTLAAAFCYALYLRTNHPLFLLLAYFGFLLNLFNMLPVPPLDGGRVTAAVSPWIWIPGLCAVAVWIVHDYLVHQRTNVILILLLLFAWPRIKSILSARVRGGPYYQIGQAASWGVGAAYIALSVTLAVLFFLARYETRAIFGDGIMMN